MSDLALLDLVHGYIEACSESPSHSNLTTVSVQNHEIATRQDSYTDHESRDKEQRPHDEGQHVDSVLFCVNREQSKGRTT